MKNNFEKGIIFSIFEGRLWDCYYNLAKTIIEDHACYNNTNDTKRLDYFAKSGLLRKEKLSFIGKFIHYPKYFKVENFIIMKDGINFVKHINKCEYWSENFLVISLSKCEKYKQIEDDFRNKIFLQFKKSMKAFRVEITVKDFNHIFYKQKFTDKVIEMCKSK